jgi:hypothetical protein
MLAVACDALSHAALSPGDSADLVSHMAGLT